MSVELIGEVREELDRVKADPSPDSWREVQAILDDVALNLTKIVEHGKRADSIVRGMLEHSRATTDARRPTDVNALLAEYANLAYHGVRAQDSSFNLTIHSDYDDTIGEIEVAPQDLSRAFLNLVTNACHATHEKRQQLGAGYDPALWLTTRNLGEQVEVCIRDNGPGIPKEIAAKVFEPFFTTKPTGEGTGLGLSITYDIVTQQHGGSLRVETEQGEFAAFIITLPRAGRGARREQPA